MKRCIAFLLAIVVFFTSNISNVIPLYAEDVTDNTTDIRMEIDIPMTRAQIQFTHKNFALESCVTTGFDFVTPSNIRYSSQCQDALKVGDVNIVELHLTNNGSATIQTKESLKAGTYHVYVQEVVYREGSVFSLSVADTEIGEYNCYKENSKYALGDERKLDQTVTLTEDGPVKIAFKRKSNPASSSYNRLFPYNIRLVNVEALKTVALSYDTGNSLEVGNTSTPTLALTNEGGNSFTGEKSIVYSSSDESVVTVDAATGDITAVKEGSASITAAVTANGKTVSGTAEITVAAKQVPVGIDILMTRDNLTFTHKAFAYDNSLITKGFTFVEDKTTGLRTGSCRSDNPLKITGTDVNIVELVTGANTWPDQKNVITIKTEKEVIAGWYSVQVQEVHRTTGSNYSLYVNDQYAGEYECYDGSLATANTFQLGEEKILNTLYIPNGQVEISFKLSSNPSGYDQGRLYPYKISLVPIEQQEALDFSLESDVPTELYVGKSLDANIKVKMSDGSYRWLGKYAATGEDETYNSISVTVVEGTECIEVSEVKTGQTLTGFTMSGLKAGNAKIRVTTKLDGLNGVYGTEGVNEKYEDFSITVGAAPQLKTVTLNYENTTLGQGCTMAPTLGLTLDDQSDYTGAYTVTYSSSKEEVIRVDTTTGVITAVSDEGVATITASVTIPGQETVVGQIDIQATVKPVPVEVYIPMTREYLYFADKGFSLTDNEEAGLKAVQTKGFSIVADKTKGVKKTSRSQEALKVNDTNIVELAMNKNLWPVNDIMFTIKADLAAEGWYSVKATPVLRRLASNFSLYVNGEYAGEFECYDGTLATDNTFKLGEEEALNTLYLPKGEVEISFRPSANPSNNGVIRLLPWSIRLTPVEGNVELKEICGALATELTIEETSPVTVNTIMSDGSKLHLGLANDGSQNTERSFDVTSSDTDILAVEELLVGATAGHASDASFVLHAKGEGTVTLTMTTTIGTEVCTRLETIVVKNDPIAKVELQIAEDEVFVGDEVEFDVINTLTSGRVLLDTSNAVTSVTSKTPDIAVVEDGIIKTKAVGQAIIEATTILNGVSVTGQLVLDVFAEGMTSIDATAGGSKIIRLTDNKNETTPFYVTIYSNEGNVMDATNATITAVALTPEIASLDEEYNIIPIKEGEARFLVTVSMDGRSCKTECSLTVLRGKSTSTYMTKEKQEIAQNNIKKFTWAQEIANGYIAEAELYVDKLDLLYDMVTSQGVPRNQVVGEENDPEMYLCRYCGADLMALGGLNPWLYDPFVNPWKIQCPSCERYFPSNDFGSLYELGLNEYGEYDRDRALEENQKLIANGFFEGQGEAREKYGYLANDLYPELYDGSALPDDCKVNFLNSQGQQLDMMCWGADDGWGYMPDRTYYNSNGKRICDERHSYIANYTLNALWKSAGSSEYRQVVRDAITNCSYAYYLTGEKKYGRVAAILLDRVADFYPDMDVLPYADIMWCIHGGGNTGKIVGKIHDCYIAADLCRSYDMVFDMYEDPEVLSYIAEKGKTIEMRYSKENASQIRTNIEDGIIRTVLSGLKDGSINGNFSYPQTANAVAAVVLDTQPETEEWLDYLFAPGWTTGTNVPGGGLTERLVDKVDHDGMGNEASTYNVSWVDQLMEINDALSTYTKYDGGDLFDNPKYIQMFYALIPFSMGDYYSPRIGDSSTTASQGYWISRSRAAIAFEYTQDPVFAQIMYNINGNTVEGLNLGLYKDAEKLQRDVQAVIDSEGTLDLDSQMMTGFGLGVLRNGTQYLDNAQEVVKDTKLDTWMYFGYNGGHGHRDSLNLGMMGLGLNLMPDLGYPTKTGTDPNRLQWVSATISHNTVMVNEENQTIQDTRGKALHFDDSEKVQVMDVDATASYPEIDEYRRSVVTIQIDEENSYVVDFFRVLGGEDHLYSLHTLSDEIAETKGLSLVPQADKEGNYIGTYAGSDVEYGQDPWTKAEAWEYPTQYPIGYTWLNNVDRSESTSENFEIKFKIKDFRNYLEDDSDLYLKMTMLDGQNRNSDVETSVSIADGYPPQKAANADISSMKYVLVKHTGEDLDTVFTTVFEPYKGEGSLASIVPLEMTVVEGVQQQSDAVRGVKVIHEDGRADYILYATNDTVLYKATDGEKEIYFKGFVGVYTVENDVNTYTYLLDGDILGETDEAIHDIYEITGLVVDFTQTLETENAITVTTESDIEDSVLQKLANQYIFVENDGIRNGTYRIESATRDGDKLTLNIGRTTLIRNYVDSMNPDAGYVYNIAPNQRYSIHLAHIVDGAPIFDAVEAVVATENVEMMLTLSATSPVGANISYRSLVLPEGAIVDEKTGVLRWKPSVAGKYEFSVVALDEFGRETEIRFYVTVNECNHKESDWIIDKASTTKQEGERHTECTICKVVLKREVLPLVTEEENTEAPGGSIEKEPADDKEESDGVGDDSEVTEAPIELNKATDSTTPETGDYSDILLWMTVILIISWSTIICIAANKKKSRNR